VDEEECPAGARPEGESRGGVGSREAGPSSARNHTRTEGGRGEGKASSARNPTRAEPFPSPLSYIRLASAPPDERQQETQGAGAERRARGAPPDRGDESLGEWADDEDSDAHARERDAHRATASLH